MLNKSFAYKGLEFDAHQYYMQDLPHWLTMYVCVILQAQPVNSIHVYLFTDHLDDNKLIAAISQGKPIILWDIFGHNV